MGIFTRLFRKSGNTAGSTGSAEAPEASKPSGDEEAVASPESSQDSSSATPPSAEDDGTPEAEKSSAATETAGTPADPDASASPAPSGPAEPSAATEAVEPSEVRASTDAEKSPEADTDKAAADDGGTESPVAEAVTHLVTGTAAGGAPVTSERAEIPEQQSGGRAVGEEAGEPAGGGART